MKKLIFAAVLLLLLSNVSAQKHTLKFEAGPEAAFAVGTLKQNLQTGLGLNATLLYSLSDHYSLFGYTGFDSFKGKTVNDVTTKTTFHVPAIVGVRYNCHGCFVGLGIGTGTYDNGQSGYSETHLAYSPQVGYSLKHLEFMAKYNSTKMGSISYNYFALNISYQF